MHELDVHAFELRQMLNTSPSIRSFYRITFSLLKHYTNISVKSKTAAQDVWWPFLEKCYLDLITYGICGYMKKIKQGIVMPVHIPVADCYINLDEDYEITLTPRYGKLSRGEHSKRIKVFVADRPVLDTMRLNGPLSRLLPSFRRISELNTCYVEEERRVANPVIMLEDTRTTDSSIYEAVSASNPDWQSSIPGLAISARDTASEQAKINAYIASLQENMVDLINHGGVDPGSTVDNLGIRKEKRKRVNETQVPLPANKRPHIFQPGNRVAILDFERHFKEEVPWIFGFPLSFFETAQAKMGANYKMLELSASSGVSQHVTIINQLLEDVSRKLFGLYEVILNSPMRVKLAIRESQIDYETTKTQAQAPKKAAPAPNPKKEEGGESS